VLIRELQALGLDVELIKTRKALAAEEPPPTTEAPQDPNAPVTPVGA